MLTYLRYFSLTSLIVVLGVAVFAGYYLRSFATGSLLKDPLVQHTETVGAYYQQEIWCAYEPVLRPLDFSKIALLRVHENYRNFDHFSSKVLGVVPGKNITILNDKQQTIHISNNIGKIFFDGVDDGIDFAALPKNKVTSKVISGAKVYENNATIKYSFLRTLIPLTTQGCKASAAATSGQPTQAVLEIFYDITSVQSKMLYFQVVVTVAIVALFIVLYAALYFTSHRTEKIISKQHEEKIDLERAKAQAEEQNKQKSMFLANVSHELRTPLNAIIGFSEILKKETMGPIGHEQYKEYINDINASGVHLLSLINDILDYSKAEAQKLEVDENEIEVTKTAKNCMRMVEPRAKEAKVSLITKLPEQPVILYLDLKRFKQILLNLLSNAVKFTPEAGKVTLKVEDNVLDGTVAVTVADTGIGIKEQHISKALSAFGQIDSSLSRRYEGTGLGLPLSKRLTELMGGEFKIESVVGMGTTITLIFPKEKPAKKQQDF